MAEVSRPCKGCGEPIFRTVQVAPIPHYHGPDCRPRCSAEDCGKPQHSRGYCSAHATRAARYGDPLAPKLRQSNVGLCAVEDCDRPSRKRGWCAGHYAQWQKYGEIRPWLYQWASETACIVCGGMIGGFKSRKLCSAKCAQHWYRHKGWPPNPECARCGVEIDLSIPGRMGQRRRRTTRLCNRCKRQTRTEATPGELARRDGPHCQLCGCDVDLTAVHPDPMRPSVDHIIPRALGGSDAADNNQLTHLLCNQIKSDRLIDSLAGVLP